MAQRIWNAAVASVRADQLVAENISCEANALVVAGNEIPLDSFDRLIIVGAGKATTGMARGLLDSLPASFRLVKKITGWTNVPDNCVETLESIIVYSARPAGANEPTDAGVFGTRQILDLVSAAGPRDVCLCLISGGGSALLVAPIDGVSLKEKVDVTRFLSSNGANIEQLNTVRKQLSRVKGNGLARAFNGAKLLTLIISDVIGDPLDVVASGPTVPNSTHASDAIEILTEFDPERCLVSESVWRALEKRASQFRREDTDNPPDSKATNVLIGNLRVAVDAASEEARHLQLNPTSHVATEMESDAESIGIRMADELLAVAQEDQSERSNAGKVRCLIEGGEPTVQLVDSARRGKGGRNQQLVLAALKRIIDSGIAVESLPEFCILSGGTDGEDGPTNAAGAYIDNDSILRVRELGIDPGDFLRRNDAWNFFSRTNNLLITGPTRTNVGDVRVMIY